MEFIHLFEIASVLLLGLSVWHFKKTRSEENPFLFFIPAVLWGFIVELTAMYLYDLYYYPSAYFLTLFDVPLSIAFGWATAAYIGYYIISKKFHVRKVIDLDVDTAVVSTAFDFIIVEPIAFFYKFWVWKQNDFWFNAPFFNFVGWFLVITIFMLSYNYIKDIKERKKQLLLFFGLLSFGLIILQIITFIYRDMFGWF